MNKLIIGLGNPGLSYQSNRHNVGFQFLDYYVEKNNLGKFKLNKKLETLILKYKNFYFIKPETYMNLSGEAVYKVMKYYNIPVENILIIYDDISFEIGDFKLKSQGNAGGHNGIKNIINKLNTNIFFRIKIGIKNQYMINIKDFVLKDFSLDDEEKLQNVFNKLSNALEDFLNNKDFNKIMSLYN